ncbi:MAG: hypothetical protein Q4F57_08850 [Weeksellaceae bacterium]|nr:hypothetical protein [Weeksellaceae bacterium]
MKNHILRIALFTAPLLCAQVAIEQEYVSNPTTTILEFHDVDNGGVAKGLILPTVANPVGQAGAIVFDGTNGTFLYHNATAWVSMNEPAENTTFAVPTTPDLTTEGVIISDNSISTTDPAVLKLDSDQKVMILPRVENVETSLPNPAPGTMVYDKASKSIAIFNGEYWYFWN